MPASARPARPTRWPWLLIAAGVLLRLPFFAVQGQAGDLRLYRQWGQTLALHPWGRFYALAKDPDHLPGDILLHGLLARTWAALGGGFGGVDYFAVVRVVSFTGDLAAAALAAVLVRARLGHRAALLSAAAVLLCPAVWLDSAWWGQWDVVSTALLLGGIVIVDRTPRRWPLGVALLAWACVVKPQVALAAGPVVLGLVVLAPGDLRAAARRAAGSVGVGAAVVAAVCAPFHVWPLDLGSGWTLGERMTYAADRYSALTMYAPNLWALAPDPAADDSMPIGPLSAGRLGTVLLLLGLTGCALLWWRGRRRGADPLVGVLWWGTCNVALFYALATRCHERYLFPAVVLGIVLAALDRRYLLPVSGLAAVLAAVLLFLLCRLDGVGWEHPFLATLAVLLLASTALLVARAPRPAGTDAGAGGNVVDGQRLATGTMAAQTFEPSSAASLRKNGATGAH